MITVSAFSKVHSSFWKSLTPTMDVFVRRLNLGKYEREFPELLSPTLPYRRGLINEAAFLTFSQAVKREEGWPFPKLQKEDLDKIISSIRSRGFSEETDVLVTMELTSDELFDVEQQRERLGRMFCLGRNPATLLIEPDFPGCGIVDSGKGDLISSGVLFEIKAGDRLFRSVDIRQLIVYGALNYASKRFPIHSFGLFNPRIGISATIPLDELCIEISGKNSSELFSEIEAAISSGDISR